MELIPKQAEKSGEPVPEILVTTELHQFDNLDEAKEYINWCLAGSYADDGVEQWWRRSRKNLDNLTPQEAWTIMPERVLHLAQALL